MTDRSRPPLADRFRAASGVLGIAAAVVGAGVLVGWILGISRLLDFYEAAPEAKFNAGLCLILCGISLWLLCRARPSRGQRGTALSLAAAVVAIAALTLVEVVGGWDLGIDNLVVREPPGALGAFAPGRMAPTAAAVFLLYGVALLVLDARSRRGFPLANAPALVAALSSLFVASGYLYGVEFFRGPGTYAQVAPPIVLGQLLLAVGVLVAKPGVGITAVLVRPGLGGRSARRLVPVVLALPLAIGVAQVLAVGAGLASYAFAEALAAAAIAAITGALVLSASRVIEEQEAEGAVATEALRESEEKFSRAFLTSPYAITITGAEDGKFVEVNDAFTSMTGFTREEALADSAIGLSLWVHEEDRRRVLSALGAGRSVAGQELQFRMKSGEVITGLFSAQVLRVGNSPCILSSIADITERRRADDKLRGVLAELERSNSDLEQFASVASHDLQEPLRMVASYTQLLAERYEGQLDEKAQKYIAYAVDGAVRMQRLVNDLLTYARVGTSGNPIAPADAGRVLDQAIGNLATAIEESRAVVTHEGLPLVRADASQLRQLFQNLLANALKFRSEEVPRVHVSARDEGRDWVFAVRDNGIGIDRQYAERVFVVFQRLHTRRDYPGTGIGLAVCKRIVERHGGRIWFESEPGKGSTFLFTIPK